MKVRAGSQLRKLSAHLRVICCDVNQKHQAGSRIKVRGPGPFTWGRADPKIRSSVRDGVWCRGRIQGFGEEDHSGQNFNLGRGHFAPVSKLYSESMKFVTTRSCFQTGPHLQIFIPQTHPLLKPFSVHDFDKEKRWFPSFGHFVLLQSAWFWKQKREGVGRGEWNQPVVSFASTAEQLPSLIRWTYLPSNNTTRDVNLCCFCVLQGLEPGQGAHPGGGRPRHDALRPQRAAGDDLHSWGEYRLLLYISSVVPHFVPHLGESGKNVNLFRPCGPEWPWCRCLGHRTPTAARRCW